VTGKFTLSFLPDCVDTHAVPLDDAERAQVLSRLERLHNLINELERMVATSADRQRTRDRMRRELNAMKDAFRIIGTHDPT